MRILAYADRISAAPGERVEVKVSCERIETYEAALVRVIQGDENPDGPGYREETVPVDLGGPFPGRFQPIYAGSCGVVSGHEVFDRLTGFTVIAAVMATLPGQGCQTILARRDPKSGAGFELFLDGAGIPSFEVGRGGDKDARATTGVPLMGHRWYVVAASRCAETGRISVHQAALDPRSGIAAADGAAIGAQVDGSDIPDQVAADLTIAARSAANAPFERHFNGRIEAPRIVASVLAGADAHQRLVEDPGTRADLVAAWDFSAGIPTDEIKDVGPHRLHGRLVNRPTRGVTGIHWTGESHQWTQRPQHYGAIHFHDDDLDDARWETDFAFTVPNGLHSGVYAARVWSGDEAYYVPLCVRPPRGTASEPVAFLLPTASYMAYANNRLGIDVSETELVAGRLLQLTATDLHLQEHPELGLSFYDLHNDGSGVYYSSRRRPIVDLQPKVRGHLGGVGSNLWQFNADTHILGWLAHIGQPFDVITDEDLHRDGHALIAPYRVLLTGTHPEYTSAAMLDALEAYTDGGGRLMYLGGNGFYWRISVHPERPDVIECRKSEDGIRAFAPGPGEFFASLTGEYTGLWRRNGRAPNRLVGVGMVAQGFDVSSPYRRTAASRDPRVAFIFEGVDEEVFGDFGLSGGGAAGLELDATDPLLGTPPHALVVAVSESHTDLYLMTPEDMLDPVPGLGGTEADMIRAEMTFFETASGGAVFSTGSIAWAGAMAWLGYDNQVARITENVLRRFLDPTGL